jgi:hypothetical protein
MKNNLTFLALCFTMVLNAQWINETSCSKKASLIANSAIEYVMNLEHMAAFGAANSALIIDKDCGCAKLILARDQRKSSKNYIRKRCISSKICNY